MSKKHLIALLAILALGAFLRFYQIKEIPLGLYPDEAMNGNNALEANATGHWRVFYPENNGREGFFINLQAVSVAAFGATPWALRMVSAIIGTLTILGVYLVARELFRTIDEGKSDFPREVGLPRGEVIALFSAFFLATSYWHLNFSRIGFRAIMLPLVACFGLYFLLKGLRSGKILHLAAAGVIAGLGFYTYIAYRFMVFVAFVPMIVALRQWRKKVSFSDARKSDFPREVGLPPKNSSREAKPLYKCAPCSVALFLFIAFVAALPIGLYFFQNPDQFFNRANEISVFADPAPFKTLAVSFGKTFGMFFWHGDCNWRHNYACRPQLNILTALFFVVGIAMLIRKTSPYRLQAAILFTWLLGMALPAALTRESIPHALRAIGMIPPVMILSGLGASTALERIHAWTRTRTMRAPEKTRQIALIRREILILFFLALATIPLATARDYFLRWAQNPETYDAFDTSTWHLGQYLASLPPDTKKYAVANTRGILARGIPIPAQSIMFATDTFREEDRRQKNMTYLQSADAEKILIGEGKTIVAILDGGDRALIRAIQKKHPELKVRVPGDFVVLQNY